MRISRSERLLGALLLGGFIQAGGAAHAASVTLNFDTLPDGTNFVAPTTYASTMPLRDEYAQVDGVHFLGGGGVLSGNFGVSGVSGSNLLAFNLRTIAVYQDGVTHPVPPEQILFDHPANLVRVNVGSSELVGGTAVLTAFDASGNSVGTAQLPLTTTLTPLWVQSTTYNIASVQLTLTGSRSMVADDLVFMIQDHANVPPVTQCALAGPAGTNGVFLGDVNATLTATDADDTVAATRYQLDGGAWQPYSTPVLISGNGIHTLLYQSLDSGGLWEDVKSQSVTIDTTSPVTYCALDGPAGANGVFLGDVHATLTASDPDDTVAATRYRLDSQNDADWQPYSSPVLISGNGTHTLQFQSLDSHGNWEMVKSQSVSIDTTKPVTQCALDGPAGTNGVYLGDVHATLTASDPDDSVAATHFRLDGSDWQPYTAPVLISGSGTHKLEFQSQDSSGNWEDIQSVSVSIDTTSPVTQCTLAGPAGANGWYLGDVHATLTATDPDDSVAATRYGLDGSGWQPYSTPVLISGNGTHTLQFQSEDSSGNWESVQSVSVKIDSGPPVVNLTLSRYTLRGESGRLNGHLVPVAVNGSVSDGGSGLAGVKFEVKDQYGVVQPPLGHFGQTVRLAATLKPRGRARCYQVVVTATSNAGSQTRVVRCVWVIRPGRAVH
jgi:hypothetical protein